jgi:hypothetical protein
MGPTSQCLNIFYSPLFPHPISRLAFIEGLLGARPGPPGNPPSIITVTTPAIMQINKWLNTLLEPWLTPWPRRVEALPKPSSTVFVAGPLNLTLIRPWWARIRTGAEERRTSPSFSATTTPSTSTIPSARAPSHGPRTHYPIGECRSLSAFTYSNGIRIQIPVYKIEGSDNRLFVGCNLSLVSYFL